MATPWVVLYMINIRPSSPPPPLAFSFIILFRSSSIFLRASSRALAASDFSFGFLFEGVFLETVLLFFTGSGFFTTQLALLSGVLPWLLRGWSCWGCWRYLSWFFWFSDLLLTDGGRVGRGLRGQRRGLQMFRFGHR